MDARDLFEAALERIRLRYGWAVLAYVVMPEHVHMLVSEPLKGSLSLAMQALKLSVAKRRTEKPFWQARYHDFNVWTAEKVPEKIKYTHRNPVARGLGTNQKTGDGRVISTTKPDVWEPWRLSRSGRGGDGNTR